jgi:hypothetical protein
MDHHKTAAADIAGAGIGHRHRKAGRNCRIDGVAALAQDVGADLGCEFFLRHHHAEFGKSGVECAGSRRCIETAASFLRVRWSASDDGKRQRNQKCAPACRERDHVLLRQMPPASLGCYSVRLPRQNDSVRK